jgi:hypothetical protein
MNSLRERPTLEERASDGGLRAARRAAILGFFAGADAFKDFWCD